MTRKLVSLKEAAKFLGAAAQALRHWEREGQIVKESIEC